MKIYSYRNKKKRLKSISTFQAFFYFQKRK
jgi:hypothetical protein